MTKTSLINYPWYVSQQLEIWAKTSPDNSIFVCECQSPELARNIVSWHNEVINNER